jgi:hypothetical protein
MKGKYKIILPDNGEVVLWFSTWAFKKFAQSKNMSVDEMIQYCIGGVLKSEDMSNFMLIAAENEWQECSKDPFPYSERDADKWIDALGGFFGAKLKEVVVVMIAAMFDKDPTEVANVLTVDDVKEKKSASVGRNSTRTQQKRASGRKR